eukprot:TRINITY_DN5080_c0_g2_i1.p1 TRINITY_DN5080_c0_g2~~TRINITY_DN5080_c0_g2_i1.p1  ORF type:complete len:443 (+),score=99.83 TRINITY_DN5080_c0_g2_i1:57-1385(+)
MCGMARGRERLRSLEFAMESVLGGVEAGKVVLPQCLHARLLELLPHRRGAASASPDKGSSSAASPVPYGSDGSRFAEPSLAERLADAATRGSSSPRRAVLRRCLEDALRGESGPLTLPPSSPGRAGKAVSVDLDREVVTPPPGSPSREVVTPPPDSPSPRRPPRLDTPVLDSEETAYRLGVASMEARTRTDLGMLLQQKLQAELRRRRSACEDAAKQLSDICGAGGPEAGGRRAVAWRESHERAGVRKRQRREAVVVHELLRRRACDAERSRGLLCIGESAARDLSGLTETRQRQRLRSAALASEVDAEATSGAAALAAAENSTWVRLPFRCVASAEHDCRLRLQAEALGPSAWRARMVLAEQTARVSVQSACLEPLCTPDSLRPHDSGFARRSDHRAPSSSALSRFTGRTRSVLPVDDDADSDSLESGSTASISAARRLSW